MKSSNHLPIPSHEALLTARLARAKLEVQTIEELLAALNPVNDQPAHAAQLGPTPAAPASSRKYSAPRAAKAPRKARPAAADSPVALMTNALAAMEGNFTSVDLRTKIRELGGGNNDCQNTGAFLKRRCRFGELEQITYNGEIFYKRIGAPEATS